VGRDELPVEDENSLLPCGEVDDDDEAVKAEEDKDVVVVEASRASYLVCKR